MIPCVHSRCWELSRDWGSGVVHLRWRVWSELLRGAAVAMGWGFGAVVGLPKVSWLEELVGGGESCGL